jgi:hypothetical protein
MVTCFLRPGSRIQSPGQRDKGVHQSNDLVVISQTSSRFVSSFSEVQLPPHGYRDQAHDPGAAVLPADNGAPCVRQDRTNFFKPPFPAEFFTSSLSSFCPAWARWKSTRSARSAVVKRSRADIPISCNNGGSTTDSLVRLVWIMRGICMIN